MAMILVDLILSGLAGLIAAAVMTAFEYPFYRKWGMGGVAEWQVNWVMMSALNKKWKDLKKPILSWTIASHLSHGIIAAAALRLILPVLFVWIPFTRELIILDAVVFTIILWFLFTFSGRRIYERVGRIKVTETGLLGALLSGIVFGIVLGLLLPFTFY